MQRSAHLPLRGREGEQWGSVSEWGRQDWLFPLPALLLPSCSTVDPLSTPSQVPISTPGGSVMLLRMFQTPGPSCRACCRHPERNETIHCFHLISSGVPTPVLSCFPLGWLCPGCVVSIGLCGQRMCITSGSQLGVVRQLYGHTPVFQASLQASHIRRCY